MDLSRYLFFLKKILYRHYCMYMCEQLRALKYKKFTDSARSQK